MNEEARQRLQELMQGIEGRTPQEGAPPVLSKGMVLRATSGPALPVRGMVTTQVLKSIHAQLDDALSWCDVEMHPLLHTLKHQAEEYAGYGLVALENFQKHFLEPRLRIWKERSRGATNGPAESALDATSDPGHDTGKNLVDTTDTTDTTSPADRDATSQA